MRILMILITYTKTGNVIWLFMGGCDVWIMELAVMRITNRPTDEQPLIEYSFRTNVRWGLWSGEELKRLARQLLVHGRENICHLASPTTLSTHTTSQAAPHSTRGQSKAANEARRSRPQSIKDKGERSGNERDQRKDRA